MSRPDQKTQRRGMRSFRRIAILLLFGLGLLTCLVATGRGQWLQLRPASGTATAMWHAADHGDAKPGGM